MSQFLQYPTNEYGLFENRNPNYRRRSWKENSEYWNPPLIRDQTDDTLRGEPKDHWLRTSYTRNKPRMLNGGAGPLWRDPSNYSRWCQRLYLERRFTGSIKDSKFVTRFVENEGLPIGYELAYRRIYPNGLGHAERSPDMENQAITECLNKLGDQKANLGTALAEAKSTAEMISRDAGKFWRSLKAAKRGNFQLIPGILGMKKPKHVAENVLAYKFGYAPLMADIIGGVELLKEQLKPAMLLHAERNAPQIEGDAYHPYNNPDVQVYGSAIARCQCKLTAKLDDSYSRAANRTGLANPLSIAWEVVPFSFLVDWGIPVGNLLEALSATSGLSFVGGHVTHLAWGEAQATWTPKGWSGTPAFWRSKFHSMHRRALGGFPRPGLYGVNPFKTSRLSTALALFYQLRLPDRF